MNVKPANPRQLGPPEQGRLFKEELAERRVLIIEQDKDELRQIAESLVALGAQAGALTVCPSFEAAEKILPALRPSIVISGFVIGRRNALVDLVPKYQAAVPENRNRIYFALARDNSQAALMKGLDEEVDAFAMAPATPEAIKPALLKAVIWKLDPPKALQLLEQAKREVDGKRYDEAIAILDSALKIEGAPVALLRSWLATACLAKGTPEEAEKHCQEGLKSNKTHYRCLVGLFESLTARKKPAEAYEVLKKLTTYYPPSNHRLLALVRLAMLTKAYEDMERYYRLFVSSDWRDDELVRTISAALVVCGKYYLQQKLPSRAMELFKSVAETAPGRTGILRQVVTVLAESRMYKPAEDYLEQFFPTDSRGGADYLSMKILLQSQTLKPEQLSETARELLEKRNIHDPMIYRLLIRALSELGRTDEVSRLTSEASKRWPGQSLA